MRWVFDQRTYSSERNGTIECYQNLGHWHVFVEGFGQSCPYMHDLWRQALLHVPAQVPVKRILLLGLGGGSAIGPIRRRYPDAHVTVIEWDPVMVQIANDLGLYPASQAPEIIVDDASAAVPKLAEESFELILTDLYTGGRVSASLADPAFASALAARLAPGGALVLNAFEYVALFPIYDAVLARTDVWAFRDNLLGLYRK